MLILTRGPAESVTIDGPAEVFLVRTKGNRAQLGIRAAKSTNIVRTELIAADQAKAAEAAEKGGDK